MSAAALPVSDAHWPAAASAVHVAPATASATSSSLSSQGEPSPIDGVGEAPGVASSSTLLHAEPWLPAGWFLDPGVAGAGRRAGLATSVALAAWLDASLAPLFAEVEHGKNGTDTAPQQTLTIFTSDHGPYFAGKGHAYEAGVRVPFIAHWFNGPASPGGRTIETRVTHLDVLPTLARLVGGAASTTTSMALAEGEGRAIESLLGGSESARQPSESSTPLFIEVGFSRSVVLHGYKLMVHLLPPSMATDALCRSIHGIITRKRPGIDRELVTVGPLVPMPSLSTCTMISCPRRRHCWIGGRSRRGVL